MKGGKRNIKEGSRGDGMRKGKGTKEGKTEKEKGKGRRGGRGYKSMNDAR